MRKNKAGSNRSWKQSCRELLDLIFQCEDSNPFRSPVDPIQYPDYNTVIDTPMDLTTVKEQLLSDMYDSPQEFSKDMKLIFENSKRYNTNKKSKIIGMTLRISNLFEEKMRVILSENRCRGKTNRSISKKRKFSKVKRTRRSPKKEVDFDEETFIANVEEEPSTSGLARRYVC